jgi:hypothetical protein
MITAVAGILTAVAVLIGALNQAGFFKTSSSSNSNSTLAVTPTEPERTLGHWLLVQKCPQDKACEQPFRLSDATATYIFEENYRVRLKVATESEVVAKEERTGGVATSARLLSARDRASADGRCQTSAPLDQGTFEE